MAFCSEARQWTSHAEASASKESSMAGEGALRCRNRITALSEMDCRRYGAQAPPQLTAKLSTDRCTPEAAKKKRRRLSRHGSKEPRACLPSWSRLSCTERLPPLTRCCCQPPTSPANAAKLQRRALPQDFKHAPVDQLFQRAAGRSPHRRTRQQTRTRRSARLQRRAGAQHPVWA